MNKNTVLVEQSKLIVKNSEVEKLLWIIIWELSFIIGSIIGIAASI